MKLSPSVYQMNDTFVVLGGKSGSWSVQNDVWEFDPELLKWKRSDLPKLKIARSSHAVIAVPEEAVC